MNDPIDSFYPIFKTSPKAQQARTELVDVVADVDIGIEENFGNGLESVCNCTVRDSLQLEDRFEAE